MMRENRGSVSHHSEKESRNRLFKALDKTRVCSKYLLVSLLTTAMVGCAANIPKTPTYFAEESANQSPKIRKVLLVAGSAPPKIEGVALGLSRGEGASYGAAAGAMEGAVGALSALGGCSGAFCGAALLLLLPVFTVGGAIAGSVSGAASGDPADTLAEAEAKAQSMLNSASLQTILIEHMHGYGAKNVDLEFVSSTKQHTDQGVKRNGNKERRRDTADTMLEIELLRLSLEYSLQIDARARLISLKNGIVLSDSKYKYVSERRRLNGWMANGAEQLTEAIQRGLQTLAEDAVDENFLLFYPKKPSHEITTTGDKKDESETTLVPHYVLHPVYPPLDYCFFCEGPFESRPHRAWGSLEFVEVDSVTPVLRWERFPRAYDEFGVDGKRHQISDVRYEIRIFDTAIPASFGRVLVPAQNVYSARDVTETFHKVKSELDACTDYFWTVRARFRLDGRIRVTEWAGAFSVAGGIDKPWNLRRGQKSYDLGAAETFLPAADGPEWYYYPFMTPCD